MSEGHGEHGGGHESKEDAFGRMFEKLKKKISVKKLVSGLLKVGFFVTHPVFYTILMYAQEKPGGGHEEAAHGDAHGGGHGTEHH